MVLDTIYLCKCQNEGTTDGINMRDLEPANNGTPNQELEAMR